MWGFFLYCFSEHCDGSFAVATGIDLYTPSDEAAMYIASRYSHPNGGRTWDPGRIITFTFKELNQKVYNYGVGTSIPSGCKEQDKEVYEGITYYHYECIKDTTSLAKPSDYFCYFNINA